MFKQRIEGMILGIGTSILLILSISNHVCALDVQQAIDDGVSWLLDRQGDNGAWAPRYTARTNALAVRAYVATGRTADPNYVLLLSKLNLT